ncbi:MAG: transposase IS4 family protein [Ignavibacteria bacterium]|nr:MAG: transposase IS4 family protein [Ignavibacteria bacterium]
MFIRKNKNRSGSISIQIIRKIRGRNKVIKTIGCAYTQREEELLKIIARDEIEKIEGRQSLFIEAEDLVIDAFVENIENHQIQIAGPQIVLGKIYEEIGYNKIIDDDFFKSLVICRIVYPGSKNKTVKYFKRHLNKEVSVYSVYRFLDKFHSRYKEAIEYQTYEHTRKILKGRIGAVFYDMTTLYFESSEEDELRIAGYSKDGKNQHPQIMMGLLVAENGYPLCYEIFEGNKAETKTLLPVLEKFSQKLKIDKPIVIADAALLSQKNIDHLTEAGYEFILGGRIKNENEQIKKKILTLEIRENQPKEIRHINGRLIVSFSTKRKKKDFQNRQKGLARLEKKVKNGRLTKDNINNKGYNKYLELKGKASVAINYEKFEADKYWDGLKGYITNTTLSKSDVIAEYQNLWLIEKAFRISKTDLRIRPIFHRIINRIETHICICFTAYAVYKEFERLIEENHLRLSIEKAVEEIKDIHQLTYMLPKSKQTKTKLLKLNDIQNQIIKII